MNLRRSIKIALAQRDKNASWLAGELGMSKQQMSQIMNGAGVRSDTIDKLSKALNLASSELIALGEENEDL